MSQINCSQCDETFFVTKRNLVLPFVCAECQYEKDIDGYCVDQDNTDEDIDSTTELIAALEAERDTETARANSWETAAAHRESERDMALLELGHAREDRDMTALVNWFLISRVQELQNQALELRSERDTWFRTSQNLQGQRDAALLDRNKTVAALQTKHDTLLRRFQFVAELNIHADQIQKRYITDLENSVAKKDRDIKREEGNAKWLHGRRDYWVAQWRQKCEEVSTLDRELAVHPLRRLLRASWKYVSTWRTR